MENQKSAPQDEKKEKELAALSYLWLFSVIILLARKDSDFIKDIFR